MKRILSIMIVLLLCLTVLAGCSNVKYKGPLSCVSHVGVDSVTALMDMTEDAQAEILSALNSGKWVNGVTTAVMITNLQPKTKQFDIIPRAELLLI